MQKNPEFLPELKTKILQFTKFLLNKNKLEFTKISTKNVWKFKNATSLLN